MRKHEYKVVHEVSSSQSKESTFLLTEISHSTVTKSQTEMDKFKNNVEKVAPSLVLGELYDLKLLKEGAPFEPSGKVKVSIPLTAKLKAMTDLKVVGIDENGNVTIIESEVNNGVITFTAGEFSKYGVIGKVKATDSGNTNSGGSSPRTGDSSAILLFLLMMSVSGTALVIRFRKRKVFK